MPVGGDPEGALEFAKQTVAINPQFWLGHYYLCRARLALGDQEGALQAYSDATRLSGGHSLTYTARAASWPARPRQRKREALLAEITAQAAYQYVPAYTLAVMNALLGETEAAFTWLDRAIEARDVYLPQLPRDARLQALRDDPRFEVLLRRCDCTQTGDLPRSLAR